MRKSLLMANFFFNYVVLCPITESHRLAACSLLVCRMHNTLVVKNQCNSEKLNLSYASGKGFSTPKSSCIRSIRFGFFFLLNLHKNQVSWRNSRIDRFFALSNYLLQCRSRENSLALLQHCWWHISQYYFAKNDLR